MSREENMSKEMSEAPIRRARSNDGTEVSARLRGSGPPLVLLPAGPGDCEPTWRPVLPFLTERFTCHLLDSRGRGGSQDHPDHTPARMAEDIGAYVASVGEPVGVVEWGSFVGAAWGITAAADAPEIVAVATYDPIVIEAAGTEDAARLEGIFERLGETAAEGRLAEAGRDFVEDMAAHGYYRPVDMAGGATSGFWDEAATNIPMFLQELEQAQQVEGRHPTHPEELARTRVPVLVLHGTESPRTNIEWARYVGEHLSDSRVRAVQSAGHYGPQTHPEAVADELVRVFAEIRQVA